MLSLLLLRICPFVQALFTMHSLNLLWLTSHKVSVREGESAFSLAPFNCFRMWVLQTQTFSQYMFQIIHINDMGIHHPLSIQLSFQKITYSHDKEIYEKGQVMGSKQGHKHLCKKEKMDKGKTNCQVASGHSYFVYLNPGLLSCHTCLPLEVQVKINFPFPCLLTCCWCLHHFLCLLVSSVFLTVDL